MRGGLTFLAATAVMLALHGTAQAQQSTGANFLALDVSGGYAARDLRDPGGRLSMDGWNAGANLRVLSWLGFKADVTHTAHPDARQTMYLGGVSVNDTFGGEFGTRFFGHALFGVAGGSFGDVATPYRPAVVLGGGLDALYFVRLQIDYVQSEMTPGVRRHGVRAMAGGVVPMCFRACRSGDRDGLDIPRLRQRK
jgi:hypothetical protein